MNVFGSLVNSWNFLGSPNPQPGAIDVIAIRRSDGSLVCSPFHVKLAQACKKGDKKVVRLRINGRDAPAALSMKLGQAGEAFFVERTKERVRRRDIRSLDSRRRTKSDHPMGTVGDSMGDNRSHNQVESRAVSSTVIGPKPSQETGLYKPDSAHGHFAPISSDISTVKLGRQRSYSDSDAPIVSNTLAESVTVASEMQNDSGSAELVELTPSSEVSGSSPFPEVAVAGVTSSQATEEGMEKRTRALSDMSGMEKRIESSLPIPVGSVPASYELFKNIVGRKAGIDPELATNSESTPSRVDTDSVAPINTANADQNASGKLSWIWSWGSLPVKSTTNLSLLNESAPTACVAAEGREVKEKSFSSIVDKHSTSDSPTEQNTSLAAAISTITTDSAEKKLSTVFSRCARFLSESHEQYPSSADELLSLLHKYRVTTAERFGSTSCKDFSVDEREHSVVIVVGDYMLDVATAKQLFSKCQSSNKWTTEAIPSLVATDEGRPPWVGQCISKWGHSNAVNATKDNIMDRVPEITIEPTSEVSMKKIMTPTSFLSSYLKHQDSMTDVSALPWTKEELGWHDSCADFSSFQLLQTLASADVTTVDSGLKSEGLLTISPHSRGKMKNVTLKSENISLTERQSNEFDDYDVGMRLSNDTEVGDGCVADRLSPSTKVLRRESKDRSSLDGAVGLQRAASPSYIKRSDDSLSHIEWIVEAVEPDIVPGDAECLQDQLIDDYTNHSGASIELTADAKGPIHKMGHPKVGQQVGDVVSILADDMELEAVEEVNLLQTKEVKPSTDCNKITSEDPYEVAPKSNYYSDSDGEAMEVELEEVELDLEDNTDNENLSIHDIGFDEISPEPAGGDFYESDTDSYVSYDDSDSIVSSSSFRSGGGKEDSKDGKIDAVKPRFRRYRYRRSLVPNQEQLACLDLRDGQNEIEFNLEGCAPLKAQLFVWPEDCKIVVTDIDGVITNSRANTSLLGMWAGGRVEVNDGAIPFFQKIVNNGYRVLYLAQAPNNSLVSSKEYITSIVERKAVSVKQTNVTGGSIVTASSTITTIATDKTSAPTAQDKLAQLGNCLPPGPVFKSPESLIRAFGAARTEVFKASALRGVKSLFPANYNPFHACFGNRECDMVAFVRCGFPNSRSFFVNEKGVLQSLHRNIKRSFPELLSLSFEMFPPFEDGLTSTQSTNNKETSIKGNNYVELIKGSQGEETNAQDVGPMDPAKEMATHTVAGKNNIRPVGSTGKHSSNAVLQEEGYSDYNFWKIPLPVIEDI